MSAPIQSRDDLSFTRRDECGRMINWPRNNPGVAADWEKGLSFFDREITELAVQDETEAYWAINAALSSMCGRCTALEGAFIGRVSRAAMLGLRMMRDGGSRFEPEDQD